MKGGEVRIFASSGTTDRDQNRCAGTETKHRYPLPAADGSTWTWAPSDLEDPRTCSPSSPLSAGDRSVLFIMRSGSPALPRGDTAPAGRCRVAPASRARCLCLAARQQIASNPRNLPAQEAGLADLDLWRSASRAAAARPGTSKSSVWGIHPSASGASLVTSRRLRPHRVRYRWASGPSRTRAVKVGRLRAYAASQAAQNAASSNLAGRWAARPAPRRPAR
jgi:hypothetical protein